MSIVSNVLVDKYTIPKIVIAQFNERIKELKKRHKQEEQSLYNSLEVHRDIYDAALERWRWAQKEVEIKINSNFYSKNVQINCYEQRIKLYRILDEHGVNVCLDAYSIYKKAKNNKEFEEIEKKCELSLRGDNPIYHIAGDLLEHKLGSKEDIKEWIDFVQSRVGKVSVFENPFRVISNSDSDSDSDIEIVGL